MWFEMTRADAKSLVTAPSSGQLHDAYIPEFRKWVARLPEDLGQFWDIKAERFEFKLDPRQGFENFVTIRTARKDSPESLQGINAPAGTLVLVDEAAGVDDLLFESISGSMARGGSVMVLTGNPNRNTGYFHATHTSLAHKWYTMHVNSEDVPSVSRDWIEEMRLKWGRYSNAYRIHVLGEFPTADSDTVIPRELIVAASNRDVALTTSSPEVWGLDVARFGDDKTVLTRRQGNTVHAQTIWRNMDTMQVALNVKNEYDMLGSAHRPEVVLVDSIGLGAGVVDRLRELKLPVRGINVSEAPAAKEHYKSLKEELWDRARIWFEQRDCKIPQDSILIEELAKVRKEFLPNGKLKIEGKKELRNRGEQSPDQADSFILTFAVDPARAFYGSKFSVGKAIKRGIRGIV
jgi:hypothetical protein